MKKALMIVSVLFIAVISTACINNMAIQELNNKAADFMQKGDYESAMNRLQASLDLDATMYQTHYNLGVAAINAKKYDKAVEALENGIKLKPDFADFYYSLGVAQISLADEMMETPEENQDEENAEAKTDEFKPSPEVIEKAVAYKKAAVANFSEFLSKQPNANNKADIEKMIKQSEEFIAQQEQKENQENKGNTQE